MNNNEIIFSFCLGSPVRGYVKTFSLFATKINNNYSMSPSWIWSDKITNKRVARVGYNHFISNKGEWNNCFSKFWNRVLPLIFISTILQRRKIFKLGALFSIWRRTPTSQAFLANQKARNAIVGAENLLKTEILLDSFSVNQTHTMFWKPQQIGVLPKLTCIDVHTHGEP